MSEIERAIQEFEDNAYHHSLKPEISEASKAIALRVLRSELDRERNEPKTCDGCIHLPQKYNGSLVCENCSRGTILPDRYEPRGEQNADARG